LKRSLDIPENQQQKQLTPEILDSGIFYLLAGTVFIVPLAIFPWSLDQAIAVKYLLLKLLTIMAFSTFLIRVSLFGFKLRRSGLVGASGLLLMLLVLSTAFSAHLATSINGAFLRYDGIYSYLIYFALFFLLIQYLNDKERLDKFVAVCLLSASLVALYGILQRVGIDPVPWGYVAFERTRSFSTFGNPVYLGAYLSLMLPLAVGAFLGEERTERKSAYAMATAVIGICIVLTMGRGLWVGVFAALLLMVMLYIKKNGFSVRTAAVPAIIGLLIISTAALIVGLPELSSRVESITDSGGSVGSRLSMWRSAVDIIADRPVLGHGPDALGLVFSRYEETELVRIAPSDIQNNVHNAFLQLAATSGLPALLVFLLILILFTVKSVRYIFTHEIASPVHIGLFAGVFAFLIQSTTGITGIATSTFLWVGMGTLAASWSEERLEIKPLQQKLKIAATIAVIIFAVIGGSGSLKPFLSDIWLSQARLAEKWKKPINAERYYKSAIAYSPADVKAYRELGIMLADNGGKSGDRAMWAEGIRYVETAVELSPDDPESLRFAGQAYLYGARAFDEKHFYAAERYLTKAVETRPFSFKARTMLAIAYIETGRHERARKNLEVALDVNPGDPQAHYYLGRYYEEVEEVDNALREYETAVTLDKNHERAEEAYERLANGKDRNNPE
jgi:putative inorganic carbon (HCO3(-)) transporter